MTNALIKAAKADPDKMAKGVTVKFILDGKEYPVTIKRGGDYNKDFQHAYEKAMRPYRANNIKPEQLPVDTHRTIMSQLIVDHIVVGWDAEAFQQEYTHDNCKAVFENVPEFMTFIMSQSIEADNFRAVAIKEIAGN